MIRFTKREDYAVILIHELVKNFGKNLVPLSKVARMYKIPLLFLRNIASDLRKAGIIDATEGKNGGYKLKEIPAKVHIGQILEALYKHPLFSCCQNTKDGRCYANTCTHGFSLRRFNNEFLEKLSQVTLDKLQ